MFFFRLFVFFLVEYILSLTVAFQLLKRSVAFLIAVLIFSAGYYSAPIFLQFKEFELYWGAVFF